MKSILFLLMCICLIPAGLAEAGVSDKNAQLLRAVQDGNLPTVQKLLADGADVNTADSTGGTPLHWAVWKRQSDIANVLISSGANVNAENNQGATPLYFASAKGDANMVKLLLEKGARIDIFAASVIGDTERVKVFLTDAPSLVNVKGPSVNFTPLYCAAAAEQKAVVELLIAKGADLNAKGHTGATPLFAAVWNNDIDLAELLIIKGADVNASAKQLGGLTPLHIASAKGFKAMVGVLIGRGADINAKDKNGETALGMARSKGYTDIVQLLEKAGTKK